MLRLPMNMIHGCSFSASDHKARTDFCASPYHLLSMELAVTFRKKHPDEAASACDAQHHRIILCWGHLLSHFPVQDNIKNSHKDSDICIVLMKQSFTEQNGSNSYQHSFLSSRISANTIQGLSIGGGTPPKDNENWYIPSPFSTFIP